jgi:hypothetical protein
MAPYGYYALSASVNAGSFDATPEIRRLALAFGESPQGADSRRRLVMELACRAGGEAGSPVVGGRVGCGVVPEQEGHDSQGAPDFPLVCERS